MSNFANLVPKSIIKKYEPLRKEINEQVLKHTYKYQKIYGFDMGGEKGTHNNEADAFKHAFMQAYIMITYPSRNAKLYGDYHEYVEGLNKNENNMDLWNNSIGREVVHDLKCILGERYHNYHKEDLLDIAADHIANKMKNGELITNPSDKRNFFKMKYDRLQDKDRIFYKGELYEGMDDEERKRFSDHYYKYQNKMQMDMPSKEQLDAKVMSGDMIHVRNYVRGDGVKVNGYYRHRPNY